VNIEFVASRNQLKLQKTENYNMKRVLFIATVVKTHIMPFHISCLEWFKKNNFEVHVAARNDYENEKECDIPFCDMFFDLPFERSPVKKSNLFVYKKLKRIIDNNQYEIIHCHTPMGGVLGRLAARNARKKGTKVIYTAHGFHFYKGAPKQNWLFYYNVEKFLSRFTDLLITINNEDFTIAKLFKARDVALVPGIGVDLSRFCGLGMNTRKIRDELRIADDSVVLLSAGELNKNKNQKTIFRSFAKANHHNLVLLLCGVGKLEKKLKSFAAKLGINDKVRFLGFRKDIPEICLSSDIFLFPSFREGLPVLVMEAMAAGLPIIASNIRGVTDLISNEVGGFLHDPVDYIGIAMSIDKLAEDFKLRQYMGQKNKEAVKNYDKKIVMDLMEKKYLKVLAKSS